MNNMAVFSQPEQDRNFSESRMIIGAPKFISHWKHYGGIFKTFNNKFYNVVFKR